MRALVLLVYIFSGCFASAQHAYITTEEKYNGTVELYPRSIWKNQQFIRELKGENLVKHYPGDLTGYGIEKGSQYISRSIFLRGEEKQVFLRVLESGPTRVAEYRGLISQKFYIESDSLPLIQLTRRGEFRKVLATYSGNFEWEEGQLQKIKLNRLSLKEVVKLINSGRNQYDFYSHIGLSAGLSWIQLIFPYNYENKPGKTRVSGLSTVLGIDLNLPISYTRWSYGFGLHVSKAAFNQTEVFQSLELDYVVNLTSLSFPFQFNYSIANFRWKPFLSVGGNYVHNLINSCYLYETHITETTITFERRKNVMATNVNSLGLQTGIGVQAPYLKGKTFRMEGRFAKFDLFDQDITRTQIDLMLTFFLVYR